MRSLRQLPLESLPLADVALADGEVHLWQVDLNTAPTRLLFLQSILSTDELARASEFKFLPHRSMFITARAALRLILGHYVKFEPGQLKFSYTEKGKPHLDDIHRQDQALDFNLAHSNNLAIYAVTRNHHIGVDIEFMRPDLTSEQISGFICTPAEQKAIESLPVRDRSEALLKIWTRKEAVLKALGEGLSIPPNRLELSVMPRKITCCVKNVARLETGSAEDTIFRLEDLEPAPRYKACVAMKDTGWKISRKHWLLI